MSRLTDLLFPKEYVPDISAYDFEGAYARGKRVILFDIDNTFVPHGAPADGKSLELIRRLKDEGFALCAVSNNKEKRVKMFCDAAETGYIFSAKKPSPGAYRRAAEREGFGPEQALFFGDQIFTDILGANRAGIDSVLVKPVDRKTDEIQIVLKRILEKPVVKAFFKEKNLALQDYFY